MKSSIVLSLVAVFGSINAFAAYPVAGNNVTYNLNTNGTTSTLVETIASITPPTDASDETGGLANLTVTLNGQDANENSQVAVNDLLGYTVLAENCAQVAAAAAPGMVAAVAEAGIAVAYGTYDTCHVTFKDPNDGSLSDTWYAKVPFGVLKQTITFPATTNPDGTSTPAITQSMEMAATNASL